MFKLLLCCVGLFASVYAINYGQDLMTFEQYETLFAKTYATTKERNDAKYYFNYHRQWVGQQNQLADRQKSSFRVDFNAFSDIRTLAFAARLPKAIYPAVSNDATPMPATGPTPAAFNIIEEFQVQVQAQDQGLVCSSSWAYAVAKAVQIMNAIQLGTLAPVDMSAQHLIDCTGLGAGCSTQVPQTAFDFLQLPNAQLLTQADYAASPAQSTQGMCRGSASTVGGIRVLSYARLSTDADVMRYVASGFPIIVEYNPAEFGFQHYKSGVYVPAAPKAQASQFLVVVGYGHDAESNLDYWLCLNSFGEGWGERGFIRIVRKAAYPIAKRAIFPNTLG
ncbi:CG6337 [Drosophila busckii]|uniref:CG6337 n=1 Tax=Drosophila busckii TaxID=30019 RepID=A0A0M5J2G1_DROBS|nr:ervatamin-B [Drosophila busckii]ALC41024.1 CG6337 [Drosophila busckii]